MSEKIDAHLLKRFRPPAFPGSWFLSFEGIEACGKSLQVKAVKEYFEQRNYRVLILREPGGTPFGEKLREAILRSKTPLHPVTEAHLFASSRAQLLCEVILHELEKPNTVIICDRFLDSSLAYQGMARGLGLETVLNIHRDFPLTLVPHLTFYLEVSLKTSLERQRLRNNPTDYFEAENQHFHSLLIQGYEQARKFFPERIVTINGEQTPEEVERDIFQVLKRFLEKN